MSGKKEKEKRKVVEPNGSLTCNPYQAMGWMYGFLCREVEDGKDIRLIEVPEMIALAEKEIPKNILRQVENKFHNSF